MFKLVTRQTRCLLASLRPLCATSASQYGTHKTATGPILDLNVVQPVYPDFIPHNTTVVQRFFETASLWPNKVAMECGLTGRKYTYEQLRQLTRRFGSALSRMGFRQGEVAGLILPNMPEFPIALFGASGIGMPVTLANPLYTDEELTHQCVTTGVTVLIGVPMLAEKMLQVMQRVSSIRMMVLIGGNLEGFVSFEQMLADSGDLFNENIDVDPSEDVFVLPQSSGTTGPPKSVMLTHRNILCNIQQALNANEYNRSGIKFTQRHDRDILVGIVPFFHSFGLNAQLLTSLETGARVVTVPKFDPVSYVNVTNRVQPTIMLVAPPLAAFLVQCPGFQSQTFNRLHLIFSGGAPLGMALSHRVLDRFRDIDFSLQEGFGLTETSPATHFSPSFNGKIGSVGGPLSKTLSKVIDSDTGESLGPNQQGELCVMGPQVMKGYYNNPKATEDCLDSSGWLHTGDVAYYDDDRHFHIVGRFKELIKVKGLQVSPSELEEVILQFGGILEVCVVGVVDEYAGELPRAYVVPKPGVHIKEEELKRFVHARVAPHKYLHGGINFIDSIPKSNTGKTLRRELQLSAAKSV